MNIPFEALATIAIYILGSSVGFIWWMATITAELKYLKELLKTMNENNTLYARKEDVVRELALFEKQQETMWIKLDRLKEKVDTDGKIN